jgi:hypothetical protein
MDLTAILAEGAKLEKTLGDKLFAVVALFDRLNADWKTIVDNGKAIGKIAQAGDPVALFDAIRADLDTPGIAQVFKDAKCLDLLDDLKELAATFDKKVLPDEVRTLLKPLGDFRETASGTDATFKSWVTGSDPGRLRWKKDGKLAATSDNGGGAVADFQLGVGIDLDCEAGSLWFYDRDRVPVEGLVRVGVAGTLTAGGKGKAPFGQLVGNLETDAGVKAQAHLFWRRKPTMTYAAALLDIAKAPVNIFSLDAVSGAMQGDDGFVGAILAIDGHASVNIDLALARECAAGGLFDAKAGLTITVDLARKAAYELSILKVDQGVRLVLSHGDDDAAGWGLGIGVDIDPGPITRRIADVLRDASDHWDAVLAPIRPFLSPGTWLRDHLAANLDGMLAKLTKTLDPVYAKALDRDLRLAMGYGSGDPGLAAVLTGKIVDAIASAERAATGAADDITSQVVTRLSAVLPSLLADPLNNALKEEITKLVTSLQDEFAKAAKDVAASSPAADIDAALKKLGAQVTHWTDDLDRRAKGIRDLVEKADDLIHGIAADAQKAATAKISARLNFERQRLDQEHYDFAADITRVTPETSALYEAVLAGRLDPVARLLASGAEMNGLSLDKTRCSVERFSKVSSRLGYEVVILGLQLSGELVVTGQADVTWGLDGRISLKTEALASRAANRWGDGRSANLIQTYSLALRRVDGGGRPADLQKGMGLDLTTERADKDLTVNEVAAYLKRMVDMGLLSEGRVQRLRDHVAGQAATRGKAKLPGTINIAMSFSDKEVDTLMLWGAAITNAASPATRTKARYDAYTYVLGNLLATGEWKPELFVYWVETYFLHGQQFKGTMQERMAAASEWLSHNPDARATPPSHNPHFPPDGQFEPGNNRWTAVKDFESLLVGMSAIWNAVPSGLGDSDLGKWDEKRYRLEETKIARCAEDWLGVGTKLFAFDPGIDQYTVALMRNLAGLSAGKKADNGTYDPMFALTLILAGEAKAF